MLVRIKMTNNNSFRNPPLSAEIGMVILAIFILCAIFAPFIAPFGEAESVGKTWLGPSSKLAVICYLE